jgi:hypothetical protein
MGHLWLTLTGKLPLGELGTVSLMMVHLAECTANGLLHGVKGFNNVMATAVEHTGNGRTCNWAVTFQLGHTAGRHATRQPFPNLAIEAGKSSPFVMARRDIPYTNEQNL